MSNKIRVMFVASSIFGGGAERVLLNISNSLPINKYDVFLAITSKADVSKIEVRRSVKIAVYNEAHAHRAFARLFVDIRHFRPDYIFTSHLTIAYLFPLLKIVFRKAFKVVVRIAVPPSDFPVSNVKTKLVTLLCKFSLRKADLIIAQTQSMKQDVLSQFSVDGNHILVIQNIIDEDFLEKKGEEKIELPFRQSYYNIVASGALYSIKGFDLLIEAVAAVQRQIHNVRLYIMGDERYERGYRNKLNTIINTLGVQGCVFLLGYKDNPFPYYKAADLFVMSSRKEGFPNVVLESLFYGTPVVATDCVDFSNVIENGVNGFVVCRDSSAALTEGIVKAYGNLTKGARRQFKNFNYENIFV